MRAAVTAWAAGRSGRVDAGGDVLLQAGQDLVGLRLRQPSARDVGRDVLLRGGDEGVDEPACGLAVGRIRDLGHGLAAPELRLELALGEAEVRGGDRQVVVRAGRPAAAEAVRERVGVSVARLRDRCACPRETRGGDGDHYLGLP